MTNAALKRQDDLALARLEKHPEGHECRTCREVRAWLEEKAKERWWEKPLDALAWERAKERTGLAYSLSGMGNLAKAYLEEIGK